jgi:hypothetical protein
VGDPDWRCLAEGKWSFAKGTPVGIGVKMPRTPAVYERKVRWRKYDQEMDGEPPHSKHNYVSAKDHLDEIEQQFREEEKLKMMKEIPVEEGRRRYGSELLVAAIGAIEKSDESFRVIHDATHGVKINPRIRQRDQVRSPGLAEANTIMRQARKQGLSLLGLKGDVSKAHRRCRVREQDHCYQVCQLRPETLWLNLVGTFGVGTASYWWSRLMGAAARGALYLQLDHWSWQLVFADDLHWLAGGGDGPLNLLLYVLFLVIVGTPFSWRKFKGGLTLDWVGYWLDYTKFQAGLSDSRARWLLGWIDATLAEGSILVRAFSEALGRLGFAAGALPSFRPFLGPLYAWSAAVPGGAFVEVPIMVKIILRYLRGQILDGNFMTDCGEDELAEDDDFRADAKAEGEEVAMGGWECRNDTPPESARWWYLRLNRKDHSWVYAGGEPYRKIATLELIATLLSDLAFSGTGDGGFRRLRLIGTTDNLGNKGAVARCMTTSFPLCAALMELAARQAKSGREVVLRWAPREQNVEADELSNGDFHRFDATKRIYVSCDEGSLPIMHEMIKYGKGLYDKVNQGKLEKKLFAASKGSEGAKHALPSSAAPAEPSKRRRRGLKESDPW